MKLPSKPLVKLGQRLQSPLKAVAGNSGTSPEKSTGNSWLIQGADQISARAATAITNAQRRYAPEFYLKSGESKDVRFRSSKPIAAINRYSLRRDGKWIMVTAPGEGEQDLMREGGLRASMKMLYEIIDIEGYVDKKGKKHPMQAKFWPVGLQLYEQLEAIRKKKGDLISYTINVTKTGQKKSTAYALLPDMPGPLAGAEKVPTIRGDVAKYYAPPSVAEQRSLMDGFSPAEQADE